MGLDIMLGAAQTYLLVALALHARVMPADPVPSRCSGSVPPIGPSPPSPNLGRRLTRLTLPRCRLVAGPWRSVTRSAVVPSALVWMLSSSVAVPRTFLAVTVWPRPSLPLCTLLATSPTTGALEGPLDVVVRDGPEGSWWPLQGVDAQGGGPLLSAIVLCAVPVAILLAAATGLRHDLRAVLAHADLMGNGSHPSCLPHQMAKVSLRGPGEVAPIYVVCYTYQKLIRGCTRFVDSEFRWAVVCASEGVDARFVVAGGDLATAVAAAPRERRRARLLRPGCVNSQQPGGTGRTGTPGSFPRATAGLARAGRRFTAGSLHAALCTDRRQARGRYPGQPCAASSCLRQLSTGHASYAWGMNHG